MGLVPPSGDQRDLPPPSGPPLPADAAPPIPSDPGFVEPREPVVAETTNADRTIAQGPAGAAPVRARRIPRWAKVGVAAAAAFGVAAAMTAARRDTTPLAATSPSVTGTSPTIAAATTALSTTAPTSATAAVTTTRAAPTTPAPTTTVPPTTSRPTTAAPTTVPVTVPAPFAAADVLATLPVTDEVTAGYAASAFPTDSATTAQGCDLRAQLLRRDSTVPAEVDPNGCRVVAGQWTSAFDGAAVADPAALAATPAVSTREAWRSGGWSWNSAKRAAFAADVSDARTVRLVSTATAKARAERDVTGWLPPEGDARCAYVSDWLAVKARWGLAIDRNEASRISTLLQSSCAGLTVAVWGPAPSPAGDDATDTPPTTEPYYLDCADARRRGVTSIPRGAPGYRAALDGNGNGIACE